MARDTSVEFGGKEQPSAPPAPGWMKAARGDQIADDTLGPDQAVVRVGALQQLIEQKQQRQRAARQVHQLPDADDFGVEARPSR